MVTYSFQTRQTAQNRTRLNLSTETHIDAPVGLKKPFAFDFTLTISIGMAELNSRRVDTYGQTAKQSIGTTGGLVRLQLVVRTIRIEILHSLTTTARIEMHQSKTATVLLMRHSQSTSSPDKD